MKTLIDILTLASDHLEQKGIPNARRQAEELISEALKIPRLQLYLEHDKPILEEELQICRQYIARRAAREPAAYIAGQVTFLGCKIQVTPDVLIPRPETEILVDQIRVEEGILWDICCGSGCIGIALKKKYPKLKVVMSDICPKATALARENARANGVDVEVRTGDFLVPFEGERADYVVSNPPYVANSEYETLEPEVLAEPKGALLGGADGLDFYRRLATELPKYLNSPAKVWLEIGHNQGVPVKNIFTEACWASAEFSPDWSGRDRFFSLEFE